MDDRLIGDSVGYAQYTDRHDLLTWWTVNDSSSCWVFPISHEHDGIMVVHWLLLRIMHYGVQRNKLGLIWITLVIMINYSIYYVVSFSAAQW